MIKVKLLLLLRKMKVILKLKFYTFLPSFSREFCQFTKFCKNKYLCKIIKLFDCCLINPLVYTIILLVIDQTDDYLHDQTEMEGMFSFNF